MPLTHHARVRESKADLRPEARAAQFSAASLTELAAEMSARLSWPTDEGVAAYMAATARRVQVMRGEEISLASPDEFLADLSRVGAIHLWSTPSTGDTDDHSPPHSL